MTRVVTLGEVARSAGVSLATASRALNGSSRRVNAELAERVLAAAAELGYVPNVNAQAVARGTSNVLGLILHDIADPYFGAIAAGVTSTAERHGLMVMLCSTNRQYDREFAYVGMLRAQRARALILAGSRTTDRRRTEELGRELAAFAAGGGRVAAISQPRLPVDTVAAENRAGAKDLAIALAAQGHRRFAVLTGPRTHITANDRLAGFRAGLAGVGVEIDDDAVVVGSFTRDGGYDAAIGLLARRTGATCVFAVTDIMAVGAMAAFRDAGVSVPGQISVAGFDDIATLRDLTPSLSTVRLPLERMGEQACELALTGKPDDPLRIVRVAGEVVIRDSTKSPRRAKVAAR
jgi:LacI family transcriptional regulator, galactose operon repressor